MIPHISITVNPFVPCQPLAEVTKKFKKKKKRVKDINLLITGKYDTIQQSTILALIYDLHAIMMMKVIRMEGRIEKLIM